MYLHCGGLFSTLKQKHRQRCKSLEHGVWQKNEGPEANTLATEWRNTQASYMSLLQKRKLPKACFSMNVASLSLRVPHLLARWMFEKERFLSPEVTLCTTGIKKVADRMPCTLNWTLMMGFQFLQGFHLIFSNLQSMSLSLDSFY